MAGHHSHLGEFAEQDQLLAYEVDGGMAVEDELLAAFQALDFVLRERAHPLIEHVNPDALGGLNWENPCLEVRTCIWDHPVRITADTIEIYRAE